MAIPEARWRRARCAGVLLLCALAGCAATRLEAPQLSLVSAKVQSADLFSQKLLVRMRVVNPNQRELPVKGITYRIEVDDSELANGASAAPFVVPAMGEAEFDVQVNANLASMLLKLYGRGGSAPKKLDYRLVGKVALSGGLVRNIPFDERGSVDLK
jgi:LEA14-like dessication related protein